MRTLIAVLGIIFVLTPAFDNLPSGAVLSSIEAVGKWVANYRSKPDAARVPAVVRALSNLGAFKEPDGAGVYIGFIAGVLGSNPAKAEELISRMLSIAP